MRTPKSWIAPVAGLVLLLLVWQSADALFKIKEIILPNPLEILSAAADEPGRLLYHTGVTMLESVLGWILGASLAFLAALLFTHSLTTKQTLQPYAVALKATPLYALAPLLVLWFGNGIWSKVVMAAMVSFFPVLVAGVKGLGTVEREQLDLFRSLDATTWQLLRKLRLPNSLPQVMPAVKMATTFAVVGATIAEFTGASAGIGHLIVTSSYYLETPLMFAGITAISLSGIAFFYLLEHVERRVVFWQD